MTDINKLLYGKNDQTAIVGIEPFGDQAELFIQEPDGSIRSEFVSNRYWILAHEKLDKNFIRLKGDLFFKWGRQFSDKQEFAKTKNYYKNRDTYVMHDVKEAHMVNYGRTMYKGLKPKDVSILSFDIETTGFSGTNDKLLLISNTYRSSNGEITRKLFAYDEWDNEGAMLQAWIYWVSEVNPSIICGHNIYGFDLPFLRDVGDREQITLDLGRNDDKLHFSTYESQKRKDGSQSIAYNKVRCYGRELVDTMFLAITYDVGRKYESYGLKKIIEHEGIRFEGRVMYDAGLIRENYTNPVEWDKIKQYCIYDSDEALQLFDLMSPPIFYLTQSVPKTFQSMIETASGSQINSIMVRSYLQDGHGLPKASEEAAFEGAISIGNPGIFSNVYKVDVASLYPSIMLQYEVYDKKKDPNANFLTILKTFTSERLKNKKLAKDTGDKYYDDLQGAQKIVINSMYGFMGAAGLLFNSPENASFVTRQGREILTKALDWATSKGNKIINADTDSISYARQDESFIDEETRDQELEELNNLYPDLIHFEDDGYFPKVIVLKAKNYVLYDGKKAKIKGSALKDSKKEQACKQFQMDIIDAILKDETNYTEIYNRYVKEAMNVTDIKRWASKKTYTSKIDSSERSNETKVKDAISGTNYKEGDKMFLFFKDDGSLCLIENFTGEYDRLKMVEKVYKTAQVFEHILNIDELFVNYKLKKNKAALDKLLET